MNDAVLIGKNIPLTYKLTAKEIYISPNGEVTIIAQKFGPRTIIPNLSVEYLESICSRFYFGGYDHQNAIADIMLLNSVLRKANYDDFYYNLKENVRNHKITVIFSQLF